MRTAIVATVRGRDSRSVAVIGASVTAATTPVATVCSSTSAGPAVLPTLLEEVDEHVVAERVGRR